MSNTEQSGAAAMGGAGLAAVVLALPAWLWLWTLHPGWAGLLCGSIFLACAADVAASDWEDMIVPDRAVVGIFLSGWLFRLVDSGWDGGEIVGRQAFDHLLQSVALGGGAWLLAWFYRRARGREGLGLGDIKLMGAAGAWLAVDVALNAITLAALGALLTIGALAVVRGVKAKLSLAIPFAVFLAPAFWLMWALSGI